MLSANFEPKTTAAASRGSLATARLSCILSQRDHIRYYSDTWLPIAQGIEFKVNVLTFKVLSSHRPDYLSELLNYHPRSGCCMATEVKRETKLSSRSRYRLSIRCSCLLQFCTSGLEQPVFSSVNRFKSDLKSYIAVAFN